MRRAFIQVLLILCPACLSAQQTPVCGWDAKDIVDGTPRPIQSVLQRGQSTGAKPALMALQAWVLGCDASSGREAARLLRLTLETRRSDPVLGTLYGMVLARGPEVQIQGASGLLLRPAHKFSNAEKEATRRLLDAAQRTGWNEPAAELAALGLATRRRETLDAAAAALVHVLRGAASPELHALLGEVHLARGDYEAARVAGEAALRSGAPAGARVAGISRMLAHADPVAGAHEYLDGLSRADSNAMERYREDIALLLVPEETESWNALPPAARGEWIRKGWEWRASTATVSVPERLAEHFRRLEYARGHYLRTSFRGARLFSGLWLQEETALSALDDRGIIYIRHGVPDGERLLNDPGDLRLAWAYRRVEGGRAIFEFVKPGGAGTPSGGDWFLADPFENTCDSQQQVQAIRAQAGLAYRPLVSPQMSKAARESYFDWMREWGPLAKPLALRGYACNVTVAGDSGSKKFWAGNELRERTKYVVLRTETASPRMREPLNVILNTYAFRAAAGTEIIVFGLIDAEGIRGLKGEAGTQYALRLYTAVEDPRTRSVSDSDSVFTLGPRVPFARGDGLRTMTRLLATPSPGATVRMRLTNRADSLQGQMVSTARAIPDFSSQTLTLSDLVVGVQGGGQLRRGSARITPVPGHAVRQGESFRVFAEAYNVTDDAPVEITVLVSPVSGGKLLDRLQELIARRNALSLRFTERAEREGDGVVRILKDVSAQLEPGPYWLQVKVQDVTSGAEASTRALITVMEQ